MEWVVRGGTVVTPEGTRATDLRLRGGRIDSWDGGSKPGDVREADARGCLVLPGGIDPHVHLGLATPHGVSSDDFASGTRAAACGGVTTVLDFAPFEAGVPIAERLRRRSLAARERAAVDYAFHVELGREDVSRGEEIRAAARGGQRSFKVYMAFEDPRVEVDRDALFRLAEAVGEGGGVLLVHAEDGPEIRRRRAALEVRGRTLPRYHADARPPETEVRAVGAALEVSRETGCRTYIVHVSTGEAAEEVRAAKALGAPVRAETCPHYLLLTRERYEGEDGALYLANPPLRTAEDGEALWLAVRDGTIDVIATDHCPFASSVKMRYASSFADVPKGLAGIETRLPLLYSEGVVRRGLPVERLAALLSANAAEIFGLAPGKGSGAGGADADLVVLDPGAEKEIRAKDLAMNADFHPFEGRVCRGWPKYVFLRGDLVYGDGRFVGREGSGRRVGNGLS